MLDNYLNDTCDIYHLAEISVSPGYGIPGSTVMDWPDTPDEASVSCHFHVRNGSLQMQQTDPYTELDGMVKLTLPYGTDIRKNDLVISGQSASMESGIRFRAAVPRAIYGNHHITVMLHREDGLKGAI